MPRNLVVINFSGAFPAAARERVDALEVVRTTLKGGGVLYTNALLDSSNPYSSLADLLTPFARGSVLDRDGQPSCGSIGKARTIFHHMRSKGYASTFIGAFGIPTDEDEHDAAMRRVGVDAFSRADSFASPDPNDLKDAHVLRQAQGIMLSWSGDSNFLFVSLCGPCGACGPTAAGDAQTLPNCDRHVSLVDGLLCSLMECTATAGGGQPALIMVSASHVEPAHAPPPITKETSTLRQQPLGVYASFALLTGTASQGLRCDTPVPLREILHEALKAAAADRDPSPSLTCDAVHVAYDLSTGVLQRWSGCGANAAATPLDYPGFRVACQASAVLADDAACPVWVEASFSIRALVAWTMPSVAHAWDAMTIGDKVRVAASRSTWKLDVATDAPGCDICVASGRAVDAAARERAIAILASAVRGCMQTVELAFHPSDLSMLLYAATRARPRSCEADAVLHVVDELGNVLQRVCGVYSATQLVTLAKLNAVLHTPDGNAVVVRVADPQPGDGVVHAARARPASSRASGGGAVGATRHDAATCVFLHDARVDLDTIARGGRNDYYITRVALAPSTAGGAADAPSSLLVSASKDSERARADDARGPGPPPVQATRGPGAPTASEHAWDAHLVGIASAHDDQHAAALSVPAGYSRRAGVGQGAGVVLDGNSSLAGQHAATPSSQRWGVALRGDEDGGLPPTTDRTTLREDRSKASASSSGRHATHASAVATGAVAKDSEKPEAPIAGDARVVGAAKRLEKRLRRRHELR